MHSLAEIDFFKKRSWAVALEIAAVATYEVHEANEPVFNQGDAGTAFYVILSGSVRVKVRNMMRADDPGYVAAVLIAGKGFGELALHTEGALRAASIVPIEQTELLCLEKNDYNRILKMSQEVEADVKFRFVSELPFFSTCSTREIQKLSGIMTKKIYQENEGTACPEGVVSCHLLFPLFSV